MNSYLKKHAFTGPIISDIPTENLQIFVVIPCFNETSLIPVFESLANCMIPGVAVEVLAVVNSSIESDAEIKECNRKCLNEADEWISSYSRPGNLKFYTTHFPELPKKHAGVGLARKIGMDEAVRRFEYLDTDGVIVNLDVDCTVSENYLTAIHDFFQFSKSDACSIHFEHPIEGVSKDIEQAIVQYELYLRYYIHMQELIGFPWAFQTIGSAMAVRSSVYQAQGGMNKRKAGEDFYFLQKVIELGNFENLEHAVVYASPRKSDRVPFGTGKAVNDITSGDGKYLVYAPESFEQLQVLFASVDSFFEAGKEQVTAILNGLPQALRTYLSLWGVEEKLAQINSFTTSPDAFRKRFFREFNAFQLMKYLHWMRDEYFANVEIGSGLNYLFPKLHIERKESLVKDLITFREFDKSKSKSIT